MLILQQMQQGTNIITLELICHLDTYLISLKGRTYMGFIISDLISWSKLGRFQTEHMHWNKTTQ